MRWVFFIRRFNESRIGMTGTMRRRLALFGVLNLAMLSAVATTAAPPDSALAQLRTRFDHAASPTERVEASWALADGLLEQGLMLQAERVLRAAAAQPTDAAHQTGTALRLGAALAAAGKYEEARAQLKIAQDSESLLSAPDRERLQEAQGRAAVASADLVAAEHAFEAAAESAQAAGAPVAQVRARTNALRARIDRRRSQVSKSDCTHLIQRAKRYRAVRTAPCCSWPSESSSSARCGSSLSGRSQGAGLRKVHTCAGGGRNDVDASICRGPAWSPLRG